jgi:GNAT superfamily N-acetyltransferase
MFTLLHRILRRLRDALYTAVSDYVRVRDLSDGIPLSIRLKDGDVIKKICAESIAALRIRFPSAIVDDFQTRAKDSQGFVAYSGSNAVGYIWVSLNPRNCEGEPPFTYQIVPATDQAYLYDLKIDPIARGRGLGAAMMSSGINWAIENNAKTIIFTTGFDNEPVHRLTQLLGFSDIGLIHFKRILGFSLKNLQALSLATNTGVIK